MKYPNERGVALVLALTVLTVLVGMAGYFSINIGQELQGSKGFLSGIKAEALAEAGLAKTMARIREDVRTTVMFNPDILDADKTPDPSKFPDLVHKKYSTRASPDDGVWGDEVDSDGDGKTFDDEDEIVAVDDKGTPASIVDDDGYYVFVRDANAGLDLNAITTESTGLLAQFPSIRQESLDSNDAVISNSIADRIVTGRASLPGGRYTTVDQIRSVLGKEDFESIEPEIEHNVSTDSSDVVVSGGLAARYYGLDTSGSAPQIDYNDFKGMVIDHGTNATGSTFRENVFRFTQPDDFGFRAETNAAGLTGLLPNFDSAEPFSVVWTGEIFIPNATPISFHLEYTGGATMRIDDQVIADSSAHWRTTSPGVADATVTFAEPGWHSVLITYFSLGTPRIVLHWDGGFHIIEESTRRNNDADDPDIDVTDEKTAIAMHSFGFRSGGYYEINSTGVVRDKQGNLAAERTIEVRVRIWDVIHQSTVEDFADADTSDGSHSFVNYNDVAPIEPVGDADFWGLEYDAAGVRAFDTLYNTIKLGYWEDFEIIDNAEVALRYPFYDTSTPEDAWKSRPGSTIDIRDQDGDLDRELVFTNVIDDLVYIDWVGVGGSENNPAAPFIFEQFWMRFEEDDGFSALEHPNYEDQISGGAAPKDYDGDRHNAGSQPPPPIWPVYDKEDHNRTTNIWDGPDIWWVGFPYVGMQIGAAPFEYNFFTKQEPNSILGWPQGPGEDFSNTNNGTNPANEFETNKLNKLTGVTIAALPNDTSNIGYTFRKTYLVAVHNNDIHFFIDRITRDGSQRDPAFQTLLTRHDGNTNAEKWFGFKALGNGFPSVFDASARALRQIDSVRVIPLGSSVGRFISTPVAVSDLEAWGTVSFTVFKDENGGSDVRVFLGNGAGTPAVLAPNGINANSILGTTPSVQYLVELSMDFVPGSGSNPDFNVKQPVFADITLTYLVTPDTIYYRKD